MKPAAPAPVAEPAPEDAAPAKEETAALVPETWELPGSLGPLTTRLELEARFGARRNQYCGPKYQCRNAKHPGIVEMNHGRVNGPVRDETSLLCSLV